jgi:hypothetical protein
MQLAQHKAFAQGAAAVAAKAPRASRAARCPVAVRAEKGEVGEGISALVASAARHIRAFAARTEMASPNVGARRPCPALVSAPDSRTPHLHLPQSVDRRATLSFIAAAAALAGAKDAQAAYGDQARVFASTNKSGECMDARRMHC